MSAGEGPDAWLGLLKWTLSHQDGTAPSEARPMGDEDRAWLEQVVKEGVRDDFKAMTDIYSRLCAYLDRAATNPPPPLPGRGHHQNRASDRATFTAQAPPASTSGGVSIATGIASDFVPPPQSSAPVPPVAPTPGTDFVSSTALSTFTAPPPSFSPPAEGVTAAPPTAAVPATTPVAGVGAGGFIGERENTTEEVKALEEGVMNDLEELQDIVEQIDMAATFVKIGGFGRLIALVAPARRTEKLRLRAASVIATLTKNNPPAQAAFSSSGGHKALIEIVTAAASPCEESSSSPSAGPVPGDGSAGASPTPTITLSLPLQRAILHALSCSVMGLAPVEDALCMEPGFREFLARTLSQQSPAAAAAAAVTTAGTEAGGGEEARATMALEESCKLQSKAAFVLKALISAPEASRARSEALRPAVLGLMTGLEALAAREQGDDGDPAAVLETCIEALLAAARSPDGDRVVRDLGSRISTVAARRRQALVEAGTAATGRSQEDGDSAEYELGLWLEWDALTGPAQ